MILSHAEILSASLRMRDENLFSMFRGWAGSDWFPGSTGSPEEECRVGTIAVPDEVDVEPNCLEPQRKVQHPISFSVS